ncbi:ABC transporter ATP-binding protein [Pseudaquabacterium pictum]|uniref:Multidrug ABC transporter permease/ATP-binding protein n=1 Tax=Pseudaquabacterium pictum TaxID=2315236 RepID=A0A480ASM2_9BURK|nr:ABC transporter transmembrane domain-containing protein [Rubrivivax pictus]GCL62725.1 multidrug ABC transporter permease/ATP-binding protein [Rubrivivax pictus]
MTLFQLIAGFVRQHWRAYAASGCMLAVIALLGVWMPRQIGHMVDALVARQLSGPALWVEIGWLLAAGAAIYGLRVAWRLQLYATAYRMGVGLRVQLYQRLAQQGPRFYQGQRTGDLMALATNDVDAVELAAGEALLAGFDGTLTLALVVGTMTLGVDWRLAAVVLLPFPLMALSFWWISRRLHAASRQALDAFGALNDQVQESIAGLRTLRALGLTGQNAAQFGALAGTAAARGLQAQRWEAAYEPAVGGTLNAAMALSLGFGGWLVWRGEMTVGQLTSFGLYLGQLIWPMFATGWVLALIERGRAAWARLGPVLDAPLSVDDHGTVPQAVPGTLVAEDLQFSYPGAVQPALAGVGFHLPAGQTLGLVGPTGSGKSTLVKLLLRQWPAAQGQITWGGTALPDFTLAALRAGIAWVPQEAFLFSATVAENIALARPDATPAQIEAAARAAAVHDDIAALPQGYATPVGERGITLSGGQRQRVAIARALLADAPLLLLDDALSAVDTGTAARILQALRQQRQGRTVLIVSHRLATVMDADQILVLRHGQVAERGTHAQLLAHEADGHPGWYATQWQVQQLEASLESDGDAA